MGQIIKVTTGADELPEVLTETEPSGFGNGEYLAERPAITAVGDRENVQFVLTNEQQGIAILGETTRHVMPDTRYQTVVVVTDQRVIALVGTAEGDEEFTLDISKITDVTVVTERRTARMRIDRADGPTWKIHTGIEGIVAVSDYLRAQSDAYRPDGRIKATSQSIRGLYESTVDTAKSFKDDGVAELLPTVGGSSISGDSDTAAAGGATASPDRETGTETGERPDRPDTETAITKITEALARTDWTARGSPPESPFDLFAERADELMGIVVHCPDDERIDRDLLRRCARITGAGGTDTVMLATTGRVGGADARLATELGVRLRNVETLADASDPPTIEAVADIVGKVLFRAGWSVREDPSGPFDLLAEHGDELLGVVVHSPEKGTVKDTIEYCDTITGAAGTDTVMLATTGTVRDAEERLAAELGVRLVGADKLGKHHVTEIEQH